MNETKELVRSLMEEGCKLADEQGASEDDESDAGCYRRVEIVMGHLKTELEQRGYRLYDYNGQLLVRRIDS